MLEHLNAQRTKRSAAAPRHATAPSTSPMTTLAEASGQELNVDSVDLETILSAWQSATDRLQNTHELLRREIGRLSDELEAKNRELARHHRLADLGRMAAHVAHEVRNSLMPLTLYLSLLGRQVQSDSEARRIIDQIQAGFVGLETTVSDLLSFTSDRDPERRHFSLRPLIEELLESLRPQLNCQQIATRIDCADDASIVGDRGMVRRALLNLILNAIDVMPDGGEIAIEVDSLDDRVAVKVLDRGTGISEDVLPRLFDPFFTTKSEGTGLGLAIVERIAAAHHGQAHVSNRSDGGAAFCIEFPGTSKEL